MSLYDEIVGNTEEKKKKKQNSSTQTTSSSSLYDDIISGNYTIPSKAETSLYMGNKKKKQTQEDKAKQQAQEYVKNLADSWKERQSKTFNLGKLGKDAINFGGKVINAPTKLGANLGKGAAKTGKNILNGYIDYVASGNAEKDAKNVAKEAIKLTFDPRERQKVAKKALVSGAVGLTDLSKGAVGTMENWYETLREWDYEVNDKLARKLGIIDDEELEKRKQQMINDKTYDFTQNLYGRWGLYDDDVQRELKKNSYLTGTNGADQLLETVGQQLPSMAIADYFGRVKGGYDALNAAKTSLKGLKGAEWGKAALGNMTKSAVMNAPTNIEMGLRSYGAATTEALKDGATYEQARRAGVPKTAVEIFTEYLTGGIPGIEESTGLLSNAANAIIDKSTGKIQNKYLKQISKKLLEKGFDFVGEGSEEAISELLDPVINKYTYKQDEPIDWNEAKKNAWNAFLMGGGSSLLMSGFGDVYNAYNNNQIQKQARLDSFSQQAIPTMQQIWQNRQMQQQNQQMFNQSIDNQVQQIQQAVATQQITPQQGQQALAILQNQNNGVQPTVTSVQQQTPVVEQENAPTINETTQDNINTQEQQNVAQNANNEVDKAEKSYREYDKEISDLEDSIDDLEDYIEKNEDYHSDNPEIEAEYQQELNEKRTELENVNKRISELRKNRESQYLKEIQKLPNPTNKTEFEGFSSTNTDFPYANKILNAKGEERIQALKDEGLRDAYVVEMTPREYLENAGKYGWGEVRSFEDIKYNQKNVDSLAEAIKNGDKLPMPYLKIGADTHNQEGRHRAYAAEKAGLKTMPVLIMEKNTTNITDNAPKKSDIAKQSEAFNLGKNENAETQIKPKGKVMSLQEISDRLGVKNNNVEKTTQKENIAKQSEAFNLGENQKQNIEKTSQQEYNKVTKEEGVENEFRRLQEESRNLSNEEQQAYRNGSKEIDEELRGRLSRVLGERVESSRSSNSDDARVLKDNKSGNTFEIYDKVDGQTFRDVFEIARTYTKNGELVDLHPVETNEDATGYNDTDNYITKDGLSGYAITKDGDLISVFNANDKRGWLRAIKPDIEAKAKTLDCYMSPNQPLSEMYEKIFGFKTASVMDYNMEYDHDDIAKNHNMPQVAFMVKTDQDIETKHFNKDQYNEALEYRNSLVDNQGTSDSSFSNEQNEISDEEFENNQPEILDKMPVTKGDSIDSVRSGIKWFRKELVDRFAPIYDLSKKYNNKTLYHKADKISASDGAAQVDLGRNQVNSYGKPYTNFTDENGNKVAMSWETVYDSFDNIPVKAKNTFLVNQLNLDRLKQNVNQFNISEQQSVKTIEDLRNEYKDIDKWAENVYQYYRNLQEKMVENGRISSQQVNEWNKNNPHYVYIQRNVKGKSNKSVGFKNNNISSDNLIRRVKGGSYDILPIKVSTGDFTRNVSRALAYNDFAREYYNTIGKDSYNNSTQNMTVTDPYVEFAKENGNTVGINSEKIPIDEIFGVEPKILNDDGSGNYTIKVYENGKTIEVPISKEVFNSLGPQNIPRVGLLSKATNAYKEVLTNKNPFFGFYRNPIKDVQEMFLYSKFPLYKSLGTYGKLFKGRTPLGGKFIDKANNVTAQDVVNFYYNTGNAANSVLKNGQFTSEVQKEKGKIRKTLSKGGDAIERGNEFFESMPRITEFWNTIDSNNYTLKDGELVPKPGTTPKKSINQVISEASYNAADVTVNFKRGGRAAKTISQNGGIFFNPGVQGTSKFVRNVTESIDDARNGDFTPAKRLVARAALMGIAPALLGKIMYDDDDEYNDMQDYQKDRFYLIKIGNGNWIKIPKGRAISVIQSATRRTVAKMEGEEDPFKDYWSFVENQIAPNSPLDNNIFSPISGAITNKSWTGKQIVSNQLLEEKVEDQYDENTDEFSKWLGKKLKISPKRINYVLDQYSGVVGDMFLPQITNSAKTKTNIPGLNILENDLTINSAYSNKSTNNFYDAFNKLDKNKDNTIEDNAKKNYLNDRKKELKELRQQKKDIQNDNTLSHKEKYEQSLEIQKKINELSKQSLKDIENFDDHTYYATIGDTTYYLTTDDKGKDVWKKDGHAEKNKQKASYEDMSLYEYYKNKYDEKKNKEKKTEKDTETKEEKRYKELESKGIDRRTFYKFKDFVNNTKGDSKKGGLSKKQKVINYIQGLNHLTAKEKQALYEDYQQNSRVYQAYN